MSTKAQTSSTNPPRSRASGRSGPRSRLGCLTCRRRKVRCDQSTTPPEARDRCGNCIRLELECQYAPVAAQRKSPRRQAERSASSEKANTAMSTQSSHDLPASNAQQFPTSQTGQQDSTNTSSIPERPFAQSNSEQIDYRYVSDEGNLEDCMQFDRVVGDMPDLSAFHGDMEWSSNFPAGGVISPANGIFSTSLLPWKDFSIGFDTGISPHPDSNGQTHELRAGSNSLELPRRHSALPSWPPAPRFEADREPRASSGIDLSLLDVTEHQRQLLRQFTPEANPIPLITSTDSQWRSAYPSLISMGFGCPHLINAICSVSELNLASSKHGSPERAFAYYRSAAAKMELVLGDAHLRIEDGDLKQAFATLLLLMQAEIMAQPLVSPRSWPTTQLRAAHRLLRKHNNRLHHWTGMGNRIISWIRIIYSKAVYAAGMEKDTDRLSPNSNLDDSLSPNGTTAEMASTTRSPPPALSPTYQHNTDAHFENPDSIPTPADQHSAAAIDEPLSAAEIAYDSLHQPAYKFFLQCQGFIPRIIALDRHHHPRGSLDAELEVLHIGQRLRREIRELWMKRPQGLRVLADTDELHEVLHPRVACMIIHSFRGFVANFHAIRILLHRVAFLHYPASGEVKEAVAEILRLAREQVSDEAMCCDNPPSTTNSGTVENAQEGCASDGAVRDTSTIGLQGGQASDATTSASRAEAPADAQPTTQHGEPRENRTQGSSGLYSIMLWLWPLFMCGTECSLDERRWVLDRMYAMGSRNADKAAILLTEVTKRQDETNSRVDQRSVRQKIFSNEFDIVY